MLPNQNKRTVRFFEITGKTFVHPMTYCMCDFQREIIMTAVYNNTLIILPSGLGKSFLAAVITFNFHRWFLNSKIIVLSQTRSYLTDQINAYNSYTKLCPDSHVELPVNSSNKDVELATSKSIVLTTPQRFLHCLNSPSYDIHNLVLLVIFESTKILKCQEYKEILEKLNNIRYRIVIFLDPVGFNAKTVKQVIDRFDITKIAKKDINSPDVKQCTYFSTIECITVDISPHIISIKDAFYAVFEKYAKKLKDAKVINGNVASLTKTQIQKSKEKFIKDPPRNMLKEIKDDLIDSMTVCSFLCYGIELLHNWGVRIFYEYLFDNNKDEELKSLIVKDEHLKNQMKLLNEYLKSTDTKYESAISRIVHPKVLQLKNAIARCFSNSEEIIKNMRIIVVCSMERVVDDINRVFIGLPECVRYHCIKTNAKCLSTEPQHKEVMKCFEEGVINVLVVSNLVEEVVEVKSSLVIALEPNKNLLKLADARFNEGPEKCLFILTKGNELMKYEMLMNEKRNEQKSLEIDPIEESKENLPLFPADFNPEFECSSIKEPKMKLKNSPAQKTLVNYFNKFNCDESRTSFPKLPASTQSPSLFVDSFDCTPPEPDVNDYVEPAPVPKSSINRSSASKINEHDSFDEFILDFPANFYVDCGKSALKASTPVRDETVERDGGLKKKLSPEDDTKKVEITLAELRDESFVDDLFADSPEMVENSFETKSTAIKSSRKVSIELKDIENESFCDTLFDDSPKRAENGANSDPELFPASPKDDKSIIFDSDDEIFDNTALKRATKCSSFIGDKSATSKAAAVEIPSNFFDDSEIDSLGRRKSNGLDSSQNTSPIIGSAKRSFRKKSLMADQSSSIRFGSYDRQELQSKSALDDDILADQSDRIRTAKMKLLETGAANGGSFLKPKPSISFPDDDDFILSKSTVSRLITPEMARGMQSSTPISSAKKSSILRRSRPLFDDSKSSDAIRTPSPSIEKTKRSTTNEDWKKRILFSNFTQSVKNKIAADSGKSKSAEIIDQKGEKERNGESDDDEFPWLKASPFLANAKQNGDCFKKPTPKPEYDNSTPASNCKDWRAISHSPESTPIRRRTKKRTKLKRKLAEEFIDIEAEVSGEDSTSSEDYSQLSDDSFIDDDPTVKHTNIGNYLKSIKSPRVGQFRIPVMSESRLKLNVYSQAVVDHEQSYENDSFCVDDEELETEAYIPSILTQMERKLERKSKKPTQQFKRIRIIDDSSPDSPQLTRNIRKRIRRISSDSDE